MHAWLCHIYEDQALQQARGRKAAVVPLPKHSPMGVVLVRFQELMDDLGVPLAPKKTEGHSTVLSFLRIELDTEHMEARLPLGKKEAMLALMAALLAKEKVRVKKV
ncbi:hypothetical protein NDU88_005514 [Pleurodeles waltl]|uniref:Uncharacterized protein n=1 Tax=Pleurodeles waltl TaxID=8319 RepID=A0AAV7VJ81_PLEWA|nr:hypothetical protein NDU88_005514 [Pleurodeles waltl]